MNCEMNITVKLRVRERVSTARAKEGRETADEKLKTIKTGKFCIYGMDPQRNEGLNEPTCESEAKERTGESCRHLPRRTRFRKFVPVG